MKEEKFPARLHVLIARENKKALVIRRGPSKSTCVLAWDRKKNTFEVSQWIKGRIYERRSDISPSGEYWIYFAMNGKWDSESKGAWTAISKAPWLKAVSLYAKGDCWNGGGLFLNDKSYWLNDEHGHEKLFSSSNVRKEESYEPPQQYGGECLNVYYNRLQRDGWDLISRSEKEKWSSDSVFEKKLPKSWLLRKVCHEQIGSPKGKGCYWDEHELINKNSESISKPGWEWADWVDESIVYAENGCLYKVAIENCNQLGKAKLLHDFNGYKFENRQAPY
jgi:hypothetical protein